jgi:hypothetical protein
VQYVHAFLSSGDDSGKSARRTPVIQKLTISWCPWTIDIVPQHRPAFPTNSLHPTPPLSPFSTYPYPALHTLPNVHKNSLYQANSTYVPSTTVLLHSECMEYFSILFLKKNLYCSPRKHSTFEIDYKADYRTIESDASCLQPVGALSGGQMVTIPRFLFLFSQQLDLGSRLKGRMITVA